MPHRRSSYSFQSAGLAAVAGLAIILSWTAASATITQGDFTIYGVFKTQQSGRWGEGGAANLPKPTAPGSNVASKETGGPFDFNRWDLVQMRQTASLKPDYKLIKNYT